MLIFLLTLVSSEECSHFQCADGSKIIPSTFLNDNFCDCPDGSDEPLSSACRNSLFVCPEKNIFSSLVHDGVCDCCDGSDELPGQCTNTCKQFYKSKAEQSQADFTQWQKGLRTKLEEVIQGAYKVQNLENNLKSYEQEIKTLSLKIAYLQALQIGAEGPDSENEEIKNAIQSAEDEKNRIEEKKNKEMRIKGQDFGKQSEFASLFGESIEKEMGKYVYGIEFFDKAYQAEGNMRYSLGSWEGFEENYTVMKFGSGTGCPNGVSRSLKVFLKCSDALEFLEFKEVSMCTYEANISMPAACRMAFALK